MHTERAVEEHLLDAFELQGRGIEPHGRGVDGQQRGDVGRYAAHQTGVRVVGFDAQQREDERPFDVEGPPFIDRPAEDGGDLLAGHFQMVLVGDVALGLPDDATLGIECPALGGGRQGEQGRRK